MLAQLQANSSSSKYYWTDEVDNFILIYNTASKNDKNYIFEKLLYNKFKLLSENIINTYKFVEKCDENFNDLVNECVAFLFMKIDKYEKGKGKSFSYFSVICKNFLMQKSNRFLKNQPLKLFLNTSSNNDEFNNEIFAEIETIDFDKNIRLLKMVEFIQEFINSNKCNVNDKKVAEALIEVLKHNDSIDIIDSQPVYLIIGEMTNLKGSYIYRSLRKIKDTAYLKYKEWNCDD